MRFHHDQDFVAQMASWFAGILVGILITLAVVLLAGCADQRTKLFNAADLEAPLPKHVAEEMAAACGEILRKHGFGAMVVPRNTGNSMGQAISNSAVLLIADNFAGTAINDAVVHWRWHTNESGYPDGKRYVVHQVIAKSDTAMRTAGMNNALPDSHTVFPVNYTGTVVAQFYHRRVK